MKFCTITLGCKVNQYETQAIEGLLRDWGHEHKASGEGNDICLINTCAVTAESIRKSRQTIRRLKKLEPGAKIAVCGCYSQLDENEVKKLGVDLIGGTTDRAGFAKKVDELINSIGAAKGVLNSIDSKQGDGSSALYRHCGLDPQSTYIPCHPEPAKVSAFEELPPGAATNRTRALLKIQDGCNNYCTYCIVPHIRGQSRSLPLEKMAEYAKNLEKQGYKEIIITGIEISSYGKDFGSTVIAAPEPQSHCAPDKPNLITAIKTISTAAPKARLHLGSLDPFILTDGFITELGKIPNLNNHFHLSLQSGCDEVLKRMGRKYTTKQALNSIKTIRNLFVDCGITADLITGFPGETEEEFTQTQEFITKAEFTDMHIFPYSLRPGTKAADYPGQIEKSIKKERARRLTEKAEEMSTRFKQKQIGKTVKVLIEQEKDGFSTGHSTNYLEIRIKEKIKRNSIKNIKITALKNNILQGESV